MSILASAFSAFAQDSLYINKKDGTIVPFAIANVDSITYARPHPTNPIATDYVLINGVKWATRNVDAPGTFAASPESAGKFYQWNRKTAWAVTGIVTNWDSSHSFGTVWTAANDPSPAGYRVPTFAEIKTLLDANKVTATWTTQNSVIGYKLTDKTSGNSIFLPAAGRRNEDGRPPGSGSSCQYWSSTQYDVDSAYYLTYPLSWSAFTKGLGQSVRPVSE